VALVIVDVSEEGITIISMLQLLFTAYDSPISPIIFALMMEAISSSETLALTRVTWNYILEDDILHRHRHENLKSYLQYLLDVVTKLFIKKLCKS
jgi:hypothetical protein